MRRRREGGFTSMRGSAPGAYPGKTVADRGPEVGANPAELTR
jgi:hypothetical protein